MSLLMGWMMVKISELKPTIFSELEKIEPNIKLFEIIGSGQELDDLYIMMYGDRMVNDWLDSVKTAKYLKMIYVSSWDNAYYLFKNTGDILPDLGQSGVKTTLREYMYTDTTRDVSSVPSFDSVELNVETQGDTTFTHDEYRDGNINRETITTDNRDIKDFKKSFEFLMVHWVQDVVFNDVNRFITSYVHN